MFALQHAAAVIRCFGQCVDIEYSVLYRNTSDDGAPVEATLRLVAPGPSIALCGLTVTFASWPTETVQEETVPATEPRCGAVQRRHLCGEDCCRCRNV